MTQRFSCRIIIKGEIRAYARPASPPLAHDAQELIEQHIAQGGEVVKVRARHARGLNWKLKAQALRPWERKPEQRKRGPYKTRRRLSDR